MPWQLGRPACGASVPGGAGGSFRDCSGVAVFAGLVLTRSTTRQRLECWLAFACVEHVEHLDASGRCSTATGTSWSNGAPSRSSRWAVAYAAAHPITR